MKLGPIIVFFPPDSTTLIKIFRLEIVPLVKFLLKCEEKGEAKRGEGQRNKSKLFTNNRNFFK